MGSGEEPCDICGESGYSCNCCQCGGCRGMRRVRGTLFQGECGRIDYISKKEQARLKKEAEQ